MASGNLVVPVVLWGRNAPTHCISSILVTPDLKNIVTGCNDGQICIWDVTQNWEVFPRSMLFGHTAAISCLALGSCKDDKPYVVSSSENGEMCLWDVTDGRCLENSKLNIVHTNMQAYSFRLFHDVKLVCNGYYPEIHIIDPINFEVIFSLCSKIAPDWISACAVIKPVKRDDDIILAISNSGAVKVWIISGNEPRNRNIYEDESKQIRCLNAQTLTCCRYNQRTVLIVCSKYWQVYRFDVDAGLCNDDGIYDAGDFTLLCSESNRCGERWSGGDFISVDRVIVWSNEGKGYLYKLPTNLLRGKAVGRKLLESFPENDRVWSHDQKQANPNHAIPDSGEYHRHHQSSSPHAYHVLDLYTEQSLVCAPSMVYHVSQGESASRLLLRGDSEGRVIVWTLPEVSERQMTLVRQESFDRLPVFFPRSVTTLQDVWENLYKHPSGILDGLCDKEGGMLHITSTIYIPSLGQVVCGRENGTIVIVPALQSVIFQLMENKGLTKDQIPVKILEGHDGRVNCLLYPFNESTRYESSHLLSGGADFSVVLWDINSGFRLHTFTVHGGEISQLLVPPANCNPRILSSICSVANDHSVTLISLKERKCIMLAGRHLFPVQCIRWRPLDDFMVVGCADGTVYVWQMETGHLDRVVHGITAEEILNNCDENAAPLESLINPNVTLAQAIKRRNVAAFRSFAKQTLQSHQPQHQASQGNKPECMKPQAFPLVIQGIRCNTRDPDSHILFFDIESLIVQLLTEELSALSPGELEAMGMTHLGDKQDSSLPGELNDPQAKLAGFIAKVKDRAENVGQKIQAKVEESGIIPPQGRPGTPSHGSPSLKKRSSSMKPDFLSIHKNLTMEIAQLLMSCLHAWGCDPDLDKLCSNKLGLLKPQCPISYGLISRQGHMSLMLPGWHKRACKEEQAVVKGHHHGDGKVTLMQQARSASFTEMENLNKRGSKVLLHQAALESDSHDSDHHSSDFGTPPLGAAVGDGKTLHWRAEALQQETVIFSTKARWLISSSVSTQHLLSVISVANTLMSMSQASFIGPREIVRKKSSRRRYDSTHGLMLEAYDSPDNGSEDEGADGQGMQQGQIKQGWSLLAAQHCVLLPELVGPDNYKPPLLEMLARRWQDRCLEVREAAQALLLAELRRIGPEGRKNLADEWSPYLPTYMDQQHSLMSPKSDDAEDDEEDDPMLTGESPIHRSSSSFESKRKQATAIVMLGVIGAEFGHEIEPSKRKPEVETKKSKKSVQEGFSLTNYSLSRNTSKALTFLLLQAPSPKLPAHTPIRRAAIDLIGRGFTVWEPYLDVSAVLLGLLELTVEADKLVPSMTFGLPLSPAADACRTARHALSLIATARPPAFIITMAKEVARYNTMAQNTQAQHSQLHNSVLLRSRQEILRVIELLVDKMPNDVADLLVETMDVTVHCLETSSLKSRGLQELFPAICRFSMVTVCTNSKRIWVGAKNGSLAFYDLKQHSKCQILVAHSGQVVAIAVAPDGKYLATYCHSDKKLKFWQTASTTLFGIGSQQTKCVKQIPTPPCSVTPHTNILKLARLVWVDNRTVILLTVDGVETKYIV